MPQPIDAQLHKLVDTHGHQPDYSGYGQTITGERHDDILVKFIYSNSTEDIVVSTTGTATTSNANSLALVSSGTGAGVSRISSRYFTNYRPSHDTHCFASYYFPSANIDANTYQYGGLFDTDNGLAFGRQGTAFGILYRNATVDTFIPQTAFNYDRCLLGDNRAGFILDPTKLNQYRFLFGWLGIAPIMCQIYGGFGRDWITVHVFDYGNSQTTPTFSDPSLPMAVECGRTSGSGAVTIGTGSWCAGTTEGKHTHAGHRVFGGSASKTLVAATPTYIVTFQNKSTYLTKVNKVLTEATFMSASTDGTKNVLFNCYSNMTLGGASFTDVDAANSVMSVDVSATSATGGKLEFPVAMSKVDQLQLDLGSGHFHLQLLPGETFTMIGTSAGASDVLVAFRWEEYFS